jgi:hypothetical protein
LRTLAGAVPCALAAHAAVYHSFLPGDGVHGYFGWYEPAVGALSAASVVSLLAFLAVARLARAAGRPLRLRPSGVEQPLARSVRSLAATSAALLVVQETLERSIPTHSVAPASFAPSQWVALLAAVTVASLVLVLALRLAAAAVRASLRVPPAARVVATPTWSVVVGRSPRPRPLAERFGLRAPPLLPV